MVIGIDASRYQPIEKVPSLISEIEKRFAGKVEFIIAKASEGKTYTDKEFRSHISYARSMNYLAGAYHYARPENNSPKNEAENFVAQIEPYLNKPLLLALDWEGKALSYSAEWAIEWLTRVEDHTGIKPLFYIQESALGEKYSSIFKNNFGLWVAKYGNNPKTYPWPSYAMWQKTNTPCDTNFFNGKLDQLIKYATPVHSEVCKEECALDKGDFEHCPIWRWINGME